MPKALRTWHELVDGHDPEGLAELLAEDVVFYSPVVFTPQKGKTSTQRYLTAAFHVLFNETFRYVREIVGERDALLEFELELEGVQINGVDVISWDEDDRITSFKVMVRPRKAMEAVSLQMTKALESAG